VLGAATLVRTVPSGTRRMVVPPMISVCLTSYSSQAHSHASRRYRASAGAHCRDRGVEAQQCAGGVKRRNDHVRGSRRIRRQAGARHRRRQGDRAGDSAAAGDARSESSGGEPLRRRSRLAADRDRGPSLSSRSRGRKSHARRRSGSFALRPLGQLRGHDDAPALRGSYHRNTRAYHCGQHHCPDDHCPGIRARSHRAGAS
jgi:hypothetical protein